jgi:hypothetical protein
MNVRPLAAALMMTAGCRERPTVPSPAAPAPVFTMFAPARAVAQLSSDRGSTLVLFDDCSWRMEGEDAPNLGHGRYRATPDDGLVLDDDRRLSPHRHRRSRPFEVTDAPLFDDSDTGWRWQDRRAPARIPQRCQYRR